MRGGQKLQQLQRTVGKLRQSTILVLFSSRGILVAIETLPAVHDTFFARGINRGTFSPRWRWQGHGEFIHAGSFRCYSGRSGIPTSILLDGLRVIGRVRPLWRAALDASHVLWNWRSSHWNHYALEIVRNFGSVLWSWMNRPSSGFLEIFRKNIPSWISQRQEEVI